MSNTDSLFKKVLSGLSLILIFIVVVFSTIFGVNVLTNYLKTDVVTYDVVPVSIILDFMNRNKDNDSTAVVQSEQNGNNNDISSTPVKDTVFSDQNSLESLVENVMPSIVSIDCKTKVNDNIYNYIYGNKGGYTSSSSGSGIIIAQNSQEILIVTNNHVVEGANEVYVTLANENQIEAQIKGADSTSDLAVLSVSGKSVEDDILSKVRIASLGDSDRLNVGDTAIAIGNSMGYGLSVTRGVISALDRTLSSEDYSMSLIQTDAAINPGNSGGALLNSRGEVIGINSVKYVSNSTESIGYAIPIADAVPIINELINYEEIEEDEKAYMGILADTVSDSMASYFGCSEGVYIKSVVEDSPAQEAGLVAGDVITVLDGRKVISMDDIEAILQIKRGGTKAKIVYERLENGKYKEYETEITFGNKGDYSE